MARFCTFTTYENEDPDAMTESEFAARGIPEDFADYIWQDAPDKATATARHFDKMDERETWLNAGNAEKTTY